MRYGARYGAIRKYAPYILRRSKLGMAANMVRFAYRNRRTIRRGYRLARRSFTASRKRKRFSPTNFGERPGTSTGKRTQIQNTDAVFKSSRVLYSTNLTVIAKTADNNIQGRQRDMVNYRGCKLCIELRNLTDSPLYFNMAILVSKKARTIDTADFFRGNTGDRSKDFGPALTGLQLHCLPINADEYTILKHKRFKLNVVSNGAAVTGFSNQYGSSYKTISMYVPIKRQLRYDDGAVSPIQPIFLVYWLDRFGAASGQTPVNDQITMTEHHIAYWKEPASCC